jgi:hypothetical protein
VGLLTCSLRLPGFAALAPRSPTFLLAALTSMISTDGRLTRVNTQVLHRTHMLFIKNNLSFVGVLAPAANFNAVLLGLNLLQNDLCATRHHISQNRKDNRALHRLTQSTLGSTYHTIVRDRIIRTVNKSEVGEHLGVRQRREDE